MTVTFDQIDFVIVGVAKSATTWLQRQLQADSAIHMPDPELHYFSREYNRGHDWYLSQFSPTPATRVIGEKSNSYLDTEHAAARLKDALPHARLVVMLRDPVARAYSDYCMLLRRGEVSEEIELYLDPDRAHDGRFLSSSRYDVHLARLLEHYDRAAIHVARYEDVTADPQALLDGVRSHIGLSPQAVASQEPVKDKRARVLPAGLRRRLAPMKPWVAPLRGNPAFEALRGAFAAPPAYPELSDSLRARLRDYFAASEEGLVSLGFANRSNSRTR